METHIFVGQGAQFKGMGADLFSDFRTLTAIASDVLDYDLAETCLNDPDRRLTSTDVTQPALYAVSMMQWVRHFEETGTDPALVAGHSLGEYAALTVAGVFDFRTGMRLVQKRGALMAAAKNGAMLAVLGDDQPLIQQIVARYDAIDIANLNTDQQMVVSGDVAQIEAVHPVLQQAGFQVVRLVVGGAFHSALMADAATEFRAFLDGVALQAPRIPVIANLTAIPYPDDPIAIRDLLGDQIRSPVLWADSVRYARAQGAGEFREFGPKPVLTGMLKHIA